MAGFLASLFGGNVGALPSGAGQSSASGGYPRAAADSAPKTPSYSFARLQQLYSKLAAFRESDLDRGGGEAVVETVRQITEAVIWGEQNDTNLFYFFCEKSILSDLVRVLGLPRAPKKVRVQLLQTLSMLVQNIRHQTTLYYVLSNNHVNTLITMPMDFSDEEILAYFITLLKSLAMRLDSTTIKFFFIQNPEPAVFPLYIEATRFFSHRDQMVRAAVRTITLQVYRVDDSAMRRFVHKHASESYFSQLAQHLRDLWLRLNAAMACLVDGDLSNARHENELQQDLLIYISDVFELEVDDFNDVLAERLLTCAVLPVLLGGLTAPPRRVQDQEISTRALTPMVALFLIRQVFDLLRNRLLIAPIAAALLQPQYQLPATAAHARDRVPGSGLRDLMLSWLQSEDDGLLFFSASVLHGCVRGRWVLPAGFLQDAGVLPLAPEASAPSTGTVSTASTSAPAGSASSGLGKLSGRVSNLRNAGQRTKTASAEESDAAEPRGDVLLLLLRGFQHQAQWRLDTCQVLCRIVLDIFLDSAVVHNRRLVEAALRALDSAMKDAARRVLASLRQGRDDEALLDTFLDEWELHKRPSVSVAEVAGQIRRLQLAMPGETAAAVPARSGSRRTVGSGEAVRAFRLAARNFLTLRRSLAALARYGTTVRREAVAGEPWNGPSEEASPFQNEELLGSERLREGHAFQVGSMDRIVCGIVAASGAKNTRYLIFHPQFLVLAQPDLSSPGWQVVQTLWPLSQVQSLIDRGDPRTLRLGLSARRGGPVPGEALGGPRPQVPSLDSAGEDNQGAYYTLTLNFEDVRKCHNADQHLQHRRLELRGNLVKSVLEHVERSCAQPLPELPL